MVSDTVLAPDKVLQDKQLWSILPQHDKYTEDTDGGFPLGPHGNV